MLFRVYILRFNLPVFLLSFLQFKHLFLVFFVICVNFNANVSVNHNIYDYDAFNHKYMPILSYLYIDRNFSFWFY